MGPSLHSKNHCIVSDIIIITVLANNYCIEDCDSSPLFPSITVLGNTCCTTVHAVTKLQVLSWVQLYRDFIFKCVEIVASMGSIQADQGLETLLYCTSGRASEGESHHCLLITLWHCLEPSYSFTQCAQCVVVVIRGALMGSVSVVLAIAMEQMIAVSYHNELYVQ